MKRCFKCGQVKPLDDFYHHPMMSDGRLNKCKECAKADVKANRRLRAEQYAEYERERFKRPERKQIIRECVKRRRSRFPEKEKARLTLARAIASGRLARLPCEVCGSPKSQGHHEDYSKPLAVKWLCFRHHREIGHGQIVIATNYHNKGTQP